LVAIVILCWASMVQSVRRATAGRSNPACYWPTARRAWTRTGRCWWFSRRVSFGPRRCPRALPA